MGTLVVTHKDTDEILQVQSGIDDYRVGHVYITERGFDLADYNCQIIPGMFTERKFKLEKSVVGGVVVDRVPGVDEVKTGVVKAVKRKYDQVCAGTDPATGKSIYVDCTISTGTIRMNAGKDAAENMDGGVRIYERAGATEMPIVRDFYNVNHLDVPMADAIAISRQQGADALGYWQQKGAMVDAINAATTVAEVEAVDTTFSVNVEP